MISAPSSELGGRRLRAEGARAWTTATRRSTAPTVWFCSDEHTTFAPDEPRPIAVGDRVRVLPAHVDPTVALHERLHLVDGDEVVETWPVDLRGW